MAKIFMKEFSDIAVSSGTSKISKIRKEKNKTSYNPARDYYKQIREAIVDSHSKGYGSTYIAKEADGCTNLKRKPNYELIAKLYIQWLGKKNVTWFVPPRGTYTHLSSEIVLNPEIGMEYNDEKHVVKLYFGEEKISQNRANYMLHLMREKLPKTCLYHVLDIRRKKLFSITGDHAIFLISINSEIAGIESAWPSV